MRTLRAILIFLMCGLLLCCIGSAQTVITPDETHVIQPVVKKIGININGLTTYSAQEMLKNLVWMDSGFEPDFSREIYRANANGTTTTYQAFSPFNGDPANLWAGATFNIYRSTSNVPVCSGTIASSTAGPNQTYTFSSACPTATQENSGGTTDIIVIRKSPTCTTASQWKATHDQVGATGSVSVDCSTPLDGKESIVLDGTSSASSVTNAFETGSADMNVVLNGTYTASVLAKTISGSPTITFSAQRQSTGAAKLNCTSSAIPITSTATRISYACPAAETSASGIGQVNFSITVNGGKAEIDDEDFERTSGLDSTNTTVFRDEVVADLRKHCVGASLFGVPCELRAWSAQNFEEMDNTIAPLFTRMPAIGDNQNGYDNIRVGLNDFLQLCQVVGAEPWWVVPEASDDSDGAKLIEFLSGDSSTTYGAKRPALGQTAPWTSVFPKLHLEMGNENWNGEGSPEKLSFRSDANDTYFDYSTQAAGYFSSMRGSPSWVASKFDLILGMQDAGGYGADIAMQRAGANSGGLAPYTSNTHGDNDTLAHIWNPLFAEVVDNSERTGSVFHQGLATINSKGKTVVYEYSNGTSGPSYSQVQAGGVGTTPTQAQLDAFSDAAGQGTAIALQSLEHLKIGVLDQNMFSLDQYYGPIGSLSLNADGSNAPVVHQWGTFIDMGGATNAVRPEELGMEIANAAIIGPMYSCGLSGASTLALASNHNGYDTNGVPAGNYAQQYAYCFANGEQRSMILINTNVAQVQQVSFAGSYKPSGQVVVTRYAPTNISDTNEAAGTASTIGAAQKVAISAPVTVASLASDSLPAYSVTRYDWMAAAALPPSGSGDGGGSGSTPTITPIITTTFNEKASGVLLDGTKPALDTPGNSWADHAYQVWNFATGGVVASSENDGGGPTIDAGTPDVSVTFTWQSTIPTGLAPLDAFEIALLRYVDSNNNVTINVTASGLIAANATVGGNGTGQIASVNVTDPTQPLTVTTQGNVITLSCAGQTATGTIPASLLSGTSVGFTSPNTGTLVKGVSVSSITGGGGSAPAPVTTTTTLAASSTTPTTGSNVTLTATVAPNTATGTVTFSDGGNSLGTGTVANGVASYTVNTIIAGSYSYTAAYGGDSSDATSTSSAVSVTASASQPSQTATTVALAASSTAPIVNASVTLTATVSPSNASGTMTFSDNGSTVGTGTITSGVATYVVQSISSASHSYSASYGGDSTHLSSVSSAVAVVPHAVSSTGLTLIVGDHISLDLSGQPLSAGSWCVQPINSLGQVTGFEGGNGKQYLPGVACFPIVNGSIGNAVQLPDTGSASPLIGYRVKVTLPNGVALYTYPAAIHPTGSTWSFDAWTLN